MQIKKELRIKLKQNRKNISNKALQDKMISNNLLCFDGYINAKTVLFYASLDDEINIDKCISDAILNGKKVALPVCLDSKGIMKFYYINSLSDLATGHFGVREPDINKCSEVTDFTNSICIVPAIAYDKNGYRLGYGKGYYDRFLKNYSSVSVGVCYNELITENLPIGEYDVPVNYIITQDRTIFV